MSAFRSSLWAFAFQTFLQLGLTTISGSQAQKVGSTVLFFGDSYVDPGNNNVIPTLIKSSFLPYGTNFPPYGRNPTWRFSDGKILPDYLGKHYIHAVTNIYNSFYSDRLNLNFMMLIRYCSKK